MRRVLENRFLVGLLVVGVSMVLFLFMYTNTAMASHPNGNLTPPTVTLADDTGRNTADGITNNPVVTFSNLDADGTTLFIPDPKSGGLFNQGRSGLNGSVTSLTETLREGDYRGQVLRLVDTSMPTADRKHEATVTLNFYIDLTPPETPTITLPKDIGHSTSDNLTSDDVVEVGNLEGGNTIWNYNVDSGGALDGNTPDASGVGRFPIGNGNHATTSVVITATQTDLAGNVSPEASITSDKLVITKLSAFDRTKLAKPTGFSLQNDTGFSGTDRNTNDPTIVLADTLTPGQRIAVSFDNGASYTLFGSPGSNSVDLPTSTNADGITYGSNFKIAFQDVPGNISFPCDTASCGSTFTLDTEPLGAPSDIALANNTSGGPDLLTNDATVNIALTSDAEEWEYSLDGGASWNPPGSTTLLKSTTSFELPSPDAVYAADAIRIRQYDAAGNIPPATAFKAIDSTVTLDTKADDLNLSLENDTGASPSDLFTADGTVNVSGIEAGAVWEYTTVSPTNWTAGTGSSFVLPVDTYETGTIRVRQIDVAGNTSTNPATFSGGRVVVVQRLVTPTIQLANDTGISRIDLITMDGLVNVSGIETAAVFWEYSLNGGAKWETSTSDTFDIPLGSYPVNVIQVRQVDRFAHTSTTATFSRTVVVNQTEPANSATIQLLNDTGSNNADLVTYDGRINISNLGTNTVWEYSVDSGTTWNRVFSNELGTAITPDASATGAGPLNDTLTSLYPSNIYLDVTTSNTTSTGTEILFEYGGVGTGTAVIKSGADLRVTLGSAGNESDITLVDVFEAGQRYEIFVEIPNIGEIWVAIFSDGALIKAENGTWNDSSNGWTGASFGGWGERGTFDSAAGGVQGEPGMTHNPFSGTFHSGRVYLGSDLSIITQGTEVDVLLLENTYLTNTIQVRQFDLAGNTSTIATFDSGTVVVDTTPLDAHTLKLEADTGSSGSDYITNNGKLNIENLNTDFGTFWEYTLVSPASWDLLTKTFITIPERVYVTGTIQVRQTDLAGNTTTVTNRLEVDTSDPVSPTLLGLDNDTGLSSTDLLTVDGTFNIDGIETTATWEYSIDTGTTWKPGSGNSFSLGIGTYPTSTIQVRQIDIAGNTSTAATFSSGTVVVGQRLATPKIELEEDTGFSVIDYVTADATVNVSGIETNAVFWQYSINSGMNWVSSTNTTFELPDNTYPANTIQVRQVDNLSNPSPIVTFTSTVRIDTSVPASPTIRLANDTGRSNTDLITMDGLVNVSDIETDAVIWQYSINSGMKWTTITSTTNTTGTFELTEDIYKVNTIQVRQTDLAGNTSTIATFSGAVVVDKGTLVPKISLISDTGISKTDLNTQDGRVRVSNIETNATVQYTIDSGTTWLTSATGLSSVAPTYSITGSGVVSSVNATNLNGARPSSVYMDIQFPQTLTSVPEILFEASNGVASSFDVVGGILYAEGTDLKFSINRDSVSGTVIDVADGVFEAGKRYVVIFDTPDRLPGETEFRANVYIGEKVTGSVTTVELANSFTPPPGLGTGSSAGQWQWAGSGTNSSIGFGEGSGNVLQYGASATPTTFSGNFHQANVYEGLDFEDIWDVFDIFEVPEDTYPGDTIRVRQIDVAGNTSTNNSTDTFFIDVVTIDSTAPAAPEITLRSDTGRSNSDFITNDSTFNIEIENSASWQYSVESPTNWLTGTGTTFELDEGTYDTDTIWARQTDLAGNTSEVFKFGNTLEIDISTPTMLTLTLVTDTGLSGKDNITQDGTLEVLYIDTDAIWEYSVESPTNWQPGTGATFTPTENTYVTGTIKVRQFDIAGNTSTVAIFPNTLVVDVTDPSIPTVTYDDPNNPPFTSGKEDGAVWQYSIDSTTSWLDGGSTTNLNIGAVILNTLTDTLTTLHIRQVDEAGNTSPALEIDTTRLSPTAPSLQIANDTAFGGNNTDRITNDPTVLVTDLTPDIVWQYTIDSGTTWTNGPSGISSFSFDLPHDTYQTGTVRARQLKFFNVSFALTSTETRLGGVQVDLVNPAVLEVSFSPSTRELSTSNLEPGARWQYRARGDSTWTNIFNSTIATATGTATVFEYRQIDVAGNFSPPPAPILSLVDDFGKSNTDNITIPTAIVIDGIYGTATVQLSTTTTGDAYTEVFAAKVLNPSGIDERVAYKRQSKDLSSTLFSTKTVITLEIIASSASSENEVLFASGSGTGSGITIYRNGGDLSVTLGNDNGVSDISGRDVLISSPSSNVKQWIVVEIDGSNIALYVSSKSVSSLFPTSLTLVNSGTWTGGTSWTNGENNLWGLSGTNLQGSANNYKDFSGQFVEGRIYFGKSYEDVVLQRHAALITGNGEKVVKVRQIFESLTSTAATLPNRLTIDASGQSGPTKLTNPTRLSFDDLGLSSTDFVTKDNTFEVDVQSPVSYIIFGESATLRFKASAGTNTFTIPDGTYLRNALAVFGTDLAGARTDGLFSIPNTELVVIDTVAPTAVTISTLVDTGFSSTDGNTKDNKITVSNYETTGAWQYKYGALDWTTGVGNVLTLPDGSYPSKTIGFRQMDLAGNISKDTFIGTAYIIDTETPTTPTLVIEDRGHSTTDGITNDDSVSVENLEDGIFWEYSLQYVPNSSTVAWLTLSTATFMLDEVVYATSSIVVRQTDLAGNYSKKSIERRLEIDVTKPAALSITEGSDTGISNTDRVTKDNVVSISTLEAKAWWQYTNNGGANWVFGVLNPSNNNFAITPDGFYRANEIGVRQVDVAGNASDGAFITEQLTIDTTRPIQNVTDTQIGNTININIAYDEEVFGIDGHDLTSSIDGRAYPLSGFAISAGNTNISFDFVLTEAGLTNISLAEAGGTDKAGNTTLGYVFNKTIEPYVRINDIGGDNDISGAEFSSGILISGFALGAEPASQFVNLNVLNITVPTLPVNENGEWSTRLNIPKELIQTRNLLISSENKNNVSITTRANWLGQLTQLVDGNKTTEINSNNASSGPLVFDFGGQTHRNGKIVIYNSNLESNKTNLNGSVVRLLKDGVQVDSYTISLLNSDEEVTLNFNEGVSFDRVEVVFKNAVQSLKEIELFGEVGDGGLKFVGTLNSNSTITSINQSTLKSDVDVTPPEIYTAKVVGGELKLTFSENLQSSSVSIADFVAIDSDGRELPLVSASSVGAVVTLGLPNDFTLPIALSVSGNGVSDLSNNILRDSQVVETDRNFALVSGNITGDDELVFEFSEGVDKSSAINALSSRSIVVGGISLPVNAVFVNGRYIRVVTNDQIPTGNATVTTSGVIRSENTLSSLPSSTLLSANDVRAQRGITLTKSAPNIALTDESVTKVAIAEGTQATVDLSFLGNNTIRSGGLGVSYKLGENATLLVDFPAHTQVLGTGLENSILLFDNRINNNRCPSVFEGLEVVISCVSLGSSSKTVEFSNPIKLTYLEEGRFTPYFSTNENPTKVIDIEVFCNDANNDGVIGIEEATSSLARVGASECAFNEGGDMVIWTTHLTNYGTYTLGDGTLLSEPSKRKSNLLPATGEGSLDATLAFVLFGLSILVLGVYIALKNRGGQKQV